ncbi:MAG: hypothetical protein JW973_04005 [Bacteroidales bacterium]|nr:hypothetical protein [Bacteroidales bacterium]
MTRKTLLLLIIISIFAGTGNAYSQCMPDTITCKDTLEPGQICPALLPDGYLGKAYNQTVTILPPSLAVFSGIPLIIVKIRVDTIVNLPPGITYEMNADELYPDTAYCILLSGIPSDTGEFKIAITVIPYVDILGSIVEGPPVVNDTSVKIYIHEQGTMIKTHFTEFLVIVNGKNPFTEFTMIGCMVDQVSPVKLNIYNYMGVLVYSEILEAKPGRNWFRFTGGELRPGCYIYTVCNNKIILVDKLIKAR